MHNLYLEQQIVDADEEDEEPEEQVVIQKKIPKLKIRIGSGKGSQASKEKNDETSQPAKGELKENKLEENERNVELEDANVEKDERNVGLEDTKVDADRSAVSKSSAKATGK